MPASPLNHDAFEAALRNCPFRFDVALLLDMIRNGANIGFWGDRSRTVGFRNHFRARGVEGAVATDLHKEQLKGRISPFFKQMPFAAYRLSALGAVPKTEGGKPTGEMRRIFDASQPAGDAVNDFVTRLLCEVDSFEMALDLLWAAGLGCKLAKLDVKSAFRTILVRRADWSLLGMRTAEGYCWELVLPFGLRSSPALWDRVARALVWTLREEYHIKVQVFVDDFLFVFDPNEDATAGFSTAKGVFKTLGVPTSDDKEVQPTTSLVFTGVLIDTVKMTLALTSERRHEILRIVREFAEAKTATRKQMERLCGKLLNATKVLPPGRPFLNRALALMREAKGRLIALDDEFRLDMQCMAEALNSWKGFSAIPRKQWTSFEHVSFGTDAASSGGVGAEFKGQWLSEPWSEQQRAAASRLRGLSIPFLECLAVATAVAVWGHLWGGQRVVVHCDCLPVVLALNKGLSRDAGLGRLLRFICQVAIAHDFCFLAEHVSGVSNGLCDALSRLQSEELVKQGRLSSGSRVRPPAGWETRRW